ncbi:hypothetical protein PAPYR_13515 [Paratrimastix pyriformis]|uniref:Uncharacterized protein n=1 Tax=Paratrimastix pyriformis TaxID=342808 RepID=A0ABQ8U2B8_9EUKA|nr:hypothetical protein PAPYR_13515 [Paratrimastix pyriformis]
MLMEMTPAMPTPSLGPVAAPPSSPPAAPPSSVLSIFGSPFARQQTLQPLPASAPADPTGSSSTSGSTALGILTLTSPRPSLAGVSSQPPSPPPSPSMARSPLLLASATRAATGPLSPSPTRPSAFPARSAEGPGAEAESIDIPPSLAALPSARQSADIPPVIIPVPPPSSVFAIASPLRRPVSPSRSAPGGSSPLGNLTPRGNSPLRRAVDATTPASASTPFSDLPTTPLSSPRRGGGFLPTSMPPTSPRSPAGLASPPTASLPSPPPVSPRPSPPPALLLVASAAGGRPAGVPPLSPPSQPLLSPRPGAHPSSPAASPARPPAGSPPSSKLPAGSPPAPWSGLPPRPPASPGGRQRFG